MKMKNTFTTLFLGLAFHISLGQGKPEWAATFDQINKEVTKNSKAYQTLGDASKKIGHRLTGSENGKKAEQYAFDLLKSYGFDDVRFQPFTAESWSRGTLEVLIGEENNNMLPFKAVTLAHSPVSSQVEAEIVDMGNGVEADYLSNPGKAKDMIVLAFLGVLPGSPEGTKSLHRSEKTALAIKYGAKGIILINAAPGGILLTGTASVTGKLIPIPAVCIGREDGLELKQALEEHPEFASIKMTNTSGMITARNVIASIKGSKYPEEKVVVGGHLDSWDLATGAIDNGIGSFAVIDIARTIKKLKLQPERTLEFVLFMGEEEGLLGSKAYVEQAIADGSIDQVKYMLNYDMTNDPKGFSSSMEGSKALFSYIGSQVQKIDASFKNGFRFGVGLHSDHQPFMLQGIPTGGGSDGHLEQSVLNCYHADCDTFDLVDKAGMTNTVRYSSMLAFALADAPEIPVRRQTDAEVKEMLIRNNLEEPLRISGDWRWK
ncbi:M28 family peptidase [Olivibacter sitiensis]|uniref:M28 family peptidase n=1 Tax=Olivibacter sitiensis TaxID=376470 RepID=UPI001FE19879|nr:M28 family peptidase [Olivibacter sitiensis]